MNQSGDPDLRVRTRRALLDALEALDNQLSALVLIDAQALYLHTGDVDVAISEETKDADIGIDRTKLHDDPLIEAAIKAAGFHKDLENPQPGTWISPDGIPVDLMVPEAMAGPKASNRRGARIPPHDNGSMRRATGLEGSIVDNAFQEIRSFDPGDDRVFTIRAAGTPGRQASQDRGAKRAGGRAPSRQGRSRCLPPPGRGGNRGSVGGDIAAAGGRDQLRRDRAGARLPDGALRRAGLRGLAHGWASRGGCW